MINIISRSIVSSKVTGPQKVVVNLIKGLDLLGYPYVINHRLDACERLWIHDDTFALGKINDLSPKIKVVIGPNLYILPRQIPSIINLSRVIYLHPCQWSIDFWIDFGFKLCQLVSWPTGIDTTTYTPVNKIKSFILIYFKERSLEELQYIENILLNKNLPFKVLRYGTYKEYEYKKILAESRYIIWLGRRESQGIALQEALSSDIPILVWDVSTIGHWSVDESSANLYTTAENFYTNTTSAPYFDERCGIKISDQDMLEDAVEQMEKKLFSFEPRKYILENLNLEKQARDFIKIYETYFNKGYNEGFKDKVLKKGKWRNGKIFFIASTFLKDFVKYLLNK